MSINFNRHVVREETRWTKDSMMNDRDREKGRDTFAYQLLNRLVHLRYRSLPYSSIVIRTSDLAVHKYRLLPRSEMFRKGTERSQLI